MIGHAPLADATCVRCGSPLTRVRTGSGVADTVTVHVHVRCHGPCPADGGTIVRRPDGTVLERHGPAVDPEYHIGPSTGGTA